MTTTEVTVGRILTRTSGYLHDVTSHSLQPYRGCTYGSSLCGVACYVQHNRWLTRGEPWGSFLEARTNAADAYRAEHERERRWARRSRGGFRVFMSSSTDPFVPQESRLGVSAAVLEAMRDAPPDGLIVQTHSASVIDHLDVLVTLAARCELRVHLSIESDRDELPGLPPPAWPVERRLDAAARLKQAGVRTVVTVSPMLPLRDPEAFVTRLGEVAHAVVFDHFVGGDGSPDGARTWRTALPAAMEAIQPGSADLSWRDEVVTLARRLLPGRVGVHQDGFAGRLLP